MILQGDCLALLKDLADNSIDSIVTDPPYGLSFMNNQWDYDVPKVEIWKECLRVLKPGGHLLAFAGTRTQHRMAVNIEDAGFEIRDMVAWIYGSGFPKNHNIGKAIDKAAGAKREVVGKRQHPTLKDNSKLVRQIRTQYHASNSIKDEWDITAPATDEAKQWEGWGTALKPALEPITLARKPFKGTVAANILKWGTGGLNIDDCRVGTETMVNRPAGNKEGGNSLNMSVSGMPQDANNTVSQGRFPANLIHDGSQMVLDIFPNGIPQSRFFYCAKASRKERDEGLENITKKPMAWSNQAKAELLRGNLEFGDSAKHNKVQLRKNTHPTVKPIELMRYLCRLITPPNGVVLDPFMGSGSTGKAALKEGFKFIGMELEPEYVEIASARIANDIKEKELFSNQEAAHD